MNEKVSNTELLNAGLALMEQNGKRLTKVASKGRAMMYQMSNGETVRARTCNDHILIAVADSPDENANLNIEGTNWLLVVMPEHPRIPGDVIAYLIPTEIAVEEVRKTHSEWLATNPNTGGKNTTWNLWFGGASYGKAGGYAQKWAQYRLKGKADILIGGPKAGSEPINPVKAEVDAARRKIAQVAGVPLEAVRISIDFLS